MHENVSARSQPQPGVFADAPVPDSRQGMCPPHGWMMQRCRSRRTQMFRCSAWWPAWLPPGAGRRWGWGLARVAPRPARGGEERVGERGSEGRASDAPRTNGLSAHRPPLGSNQSTRQGHSSAPPAVDLHECDRPRGGVVQATAMQGQSTQASGAGATRGRRRHMAGTHVGLKVLVHKAVDQVVQGEGLGAVWSGECCTEVHVPGRGGSRGGQGGVGRGDTDTRGDLRRAYAPLVSTEEGYGWRQRQRESVCARERG
jgi:hypothetical protein